LTGTGHFDFEPDRAGATGDAGPGPTGRVEVRLLGGFSLLHDGVELDIVHAGHRLLGLLASRRHALDRTLVAGTLWPDTSDTKAAANLRTFVWRLRHLGVDLVRATTTRLSISPSVVVDVYELEDLAACLPQATTEPVSDAVRTFALDRLRGELLPDCWDSWAVLERERLRQVSLQTLERLGEQLLDDRPRDAVLLALAAVELEPFRETANLLLVRAHLAEGNPSEAIRQFHRYQALLADELGLGVSPELARLAGAVVTVP
jgi:DNA-binding SARP family transcriptional activator